MPILMWTFEDTKLTLKWILIFSPAAIAIGAGLAVLPDRVLPPDVVSHPPVSSSMVPPVPRTIVEKETVTVTESPSGKHARPEPSTEYPVPSPEGPTLQPQTSAPLNRTTLPPVPTTTSIPIPTSPVVTSVPEPQSVEQTTTPAPTSFVPDPVYQGLVDEFIKADPLGSIFVS